MTADPATHQSAPRIGSTPPAGGQFAAQQFPPYSCGPQAAGPVPGYPTADRAPFAPTGFAAAPTAAGQPVPARRRTGWLVAGCTLLAVAVLQLTRLPEWIAYDERGLIGNLTGVVALVGIGIALILTGRRR